MAAPQARLTALRVDMPRDSHSRERFSLRCAAARAVFPAAPAAVAAMRAAAAAQPGPLGPGLAADMLPERARDAEPEHDDWLEAASGAAAKGAAQGRDDAGQHLSEEPGDCASAAAVQLAAPQLLWLLAAPPAREGTTAVPSPDPSHSPGPSLSAERGQHGASRLIWQCADLTARATAQPLHVQARRTHRLYLTKLCLKAARCWHMSTACRGTTKAGGYTDFMRALLEESNYCYWRVCTTCVPA